MNSVKKWYNLIVRKRKLENSKFNEFCEILLNRFDKKYESQRQQQAEEARIAKKQAEAKARAEIFACKRCSIKYSSNTQLHKHIDEHHIKKFKNIKFEISTSVFTSSLTSLSASIISVIQDHKTSSSPPSKELLTISLSAVILNQASITSASITSFATSITSPQIT